MAVMTLDNKYSMQHICDTKQNLSIFDGSNIEK